MRMFALRLGQLRPPTGHWHYVCPDTKHRRNFRQRMHIIFCRPAHGLHVGCRGLVGLTTPLKLHRVEWSGTERNRYGRVLTESTHSMNASSCCRTTTFSIHLWVLFRDAVPNVYACLLFSVWSAMMMIAVAKAQNLFVNNFSLCSLHGCRSHIACSFFFFRFYFFLL